MLIGQPAPLGLTSFNGTHTKTRMRFGADQVHYQELLDRPEVSASCMFRRGLPQRVSPDFVQVVDLLKKQREAKEKTQDEMEKKTRLLIVGVANGQEPFSYATIFHQLAMQSRSSVDELLDLHCVDIRTRDRVTLNPKLIERDGNCPSPPEYATAGFDRGPDDAFYVKPEVVAFVSRIMDSSQSHWKKGIELFGPTCGDAQFDVISCNNILGYLQTSKIKDAVLDHLVRMLRPNGILITNPYEDFTPEHRQIMAGGVMTQRGKGLYLKAA